MSDEEDYSSSSDEDYVPSEGEAVSEEENSGDEEDLDALHKEAEVEETKSGKRKRKTQKTPTSSRKRKGGIKLENENGDNQEPVDDYNKVFSEELKKEQETKKEEQEKKKADDLWSSFLSDVGSRPKPKPATPSGSSLASISKPIKSPVVPTSNKVTITKEYDFAGETVKVTKNVDLNTEEGKKEMKKLTETKKEPEKKPDTPVPSVLGRKSGGGLGSVLNKIGKKDKISTLEKSKLDWESFKHEKGISEELQIHNRGKEGYIERMNFLSRADQRQFEIEKNIRLGTNSKR
ncbi:craniofacial development protein 1-like isoform X1 [Crassostrea virginica]